VTLSEFVQAHRIRELQAGRSGYLVAEPLVCGNGARLLVDAGSLCPFSFPLDDAGPWSQFEVTLIGATDGAGLTHAMQAGDLVRFLESAGWPEAQLGKRWKKRTRAVPAGR